MKTGFGIFILLLAVVAACTAQQQQIQEPVGPLPPPEAPEQVPELSQETETITGQEAGVDELGEIRQLLQDDLDDAISDLEQLG